MKQTYFRTQKIQTNQYLVISNVDFRFNMAEGELIDKFKHIGLTEAKAKETLKNTNLSNNLKCVINSAEKHSKDLGGSKGNLLYNIASKSKAQISHQIPLLGEYVALGKIDSEVRLMAAIGT